PLVGAQIGARFVEAGVNFVDLAGNCHVRIGNRYLVRIQGERLERPASTERGLRAPGYRVIFALLSAPELASGNVRALAAAAGGVSAQTAADVRARLLERGSLVRSRRRVRWAPGGWKAACDLFLGGFSTVLAPTLLMGRFRARESNVAELERSIEKRLGPVAWRWG